MDDQFGSPTAAPPGSDGPPLTMPEPGAAGAAGQMIWSAIAVAVGGVIPWIHATGLNGGGRRVGTITWPSSYYQGLGTSGLTGPGWVLLALGVAAAVAGVQCRGRLATGWAVACGALCCAAVVFSTYEFVSISNDLRPLYSEAFSAVPLPGPPLALFAGMSGVMGAVRQIRARHPRPVDPTREPWQDAPQNYRL